MNAFKRTQLLKRKSHKWYYLRTNLKSSYARRAKCKKSYPIIYWIEDTRYSFWHELLKFEPKFGFRHYYTKAQRNKTYLPDIRVWRNMA